MTVVIPIKKMRYKLLTPIPILFFSFLLSLLYTLIVVKHGFFYDTITQVSIPANYFYNHNLVFTLLPDNLATGHSPFVGYYLAVVWAVFGKSLLISHIAFIPFIWGFIFYSIRLSQQLSGSYWLGLVGGLALFIEPIILGQGSALSFDIIQAMFIVTAIYAFLNSQKLLIFISLLFLSLINMRSGLATIGFSSAFLIIWYLRNGKLSAKELSVTLAPVLIMLLYYFYHFIDKGWVIHNTASNRWSEDINTYSFFALKLRNIALTVFYMIENGRVWLVGWITITMIVIIKKGNFKKLINNKTDFALLILFLIQLGINAAPILLASKFYVSNKYFLSSILLLFFLGIRLSKIYKSKTRWIFIVGLLISALIGNFVIYPDTRAQSWDCTAAHWPYFKLRSTAIDYMDDNNISKSETASFFPNLATTDLIDLSGDTTSFCDLTDSTEYLFYSNVYNIDDDIYQQIFSDKWNEIAVFKKNRIRVQLFKKAPYHQ